MGFNWYVQPFKISEPEWGPRIERWSQLDAEAFALCEVFWRNRMQLRSRPDAIFLASPLASNATDWDFVEGGALSPAKFVHTLPSQRGAPLVHLMDWHGPVWCLQKDPGTIICALSEAVLWAGKEIWIASVTRAGTEVFGHLLTVGPSYSDFSLNKSVDQSGTEHDRNLLSWLHRPVGTLKCREFSVVRG